MKGLNEKHTHQHSQHTLTTPFDYYYHSKIHPRTFIQIQRKGSNVSKIIKKKSFRQDEYSSFSWQMKSKQSVRHMWKTTKQKEASVKAQVVAHMAIRQDTKNFVASLLGPLTVTLAMGYLDWVIASYRYAVSPEEREPLAAVSAPPRRPNAIPSLNPALQQFVASGPPVAIALCVR